MRTLLCALVLAACASASRTQPPAPAATVAAGSTPSNPPAPGPAAGQVQPNLPPAQKGPMTAAEAAAELAQRYREGLEHKPTGDTPPFGNSAGPEDSPCQSDDDCTTTRVAPHACCPMLCEPRAVTKQAAQVIEAHMKSCAMFKCPEPLCRPPRQSTTPACVQNRCVMKPVGPKGPA